jgi:2-methylcitrate dehydratase PrpD
MQVLEPRAVAPLADAADLYDRLLGMRSESLPSAVVASAKLLILDTIAVAWAAQSASGMLGIRELTLADGGAELSTLWGSGERVPPGAAAFCNGSLASALDFDSLHAGGGVHADAVVVPAAFAVGEQARVSGREFIAAYVAGAELTIRLGLATRSTTGWFRTATYGVFGAAVAAAKLLRLDRAELCSALGIALGQAAGTQQSHIERKLSKRIQAGLSARAGVQSAQLAKRGITGPEKFLDGKFGLFALYDDGDPSAAFATLGETFHLPTTSLKKFPACGCAHAAIEAALRIATVQKIVPDAVKSVEVTITPYMNRLVGGAFSPDGDPEVTGQFCIAYAVAATLANRRFTPAEIAPTAVLDLGLRPLLAKLSVRVDQTATSRMIPARVRVEMNDGRSFSQTIADLPGSGEAPLSADELRSKALSCLGQFGGRAERIITAIDRLEEIDDMNRIFA